MAFVYWIHKPEDINFLTSGYIGVTNRTVEVRYAEHKALAAKGSDYTVHRAIRKYGDNLIVDTLIEGSEDYCYEIENKLRPVFGVGYNCACGGTKPTMSGMKHTPEECQRISERMSGENHPLFGRPMSEETKEKIAAAQRGEKGNQYGKRHNAETRAKIVKWYREHTHPMLGTQSWMTGVSNKAVWANAVEVFNYIQNNPNYGIRKVSKNFLAKDSVYTSIYNKIKSGWIPLQDPLWLAFKEEYTKQQESASEITPAI